MNNNRGGERTIYDESLFRIFLWSGFPIFMILLFACVAISGVEKTAWNGCKLTSRIWSWI